MLPLLFLSKSYEERFLPHNGIQPLFLVFLESQSKLLIFLFFQMDIIMSIHGKAIVPNFWVLD